MEWDVVEVKVEPPLTLHVKFVDGVNGKVHFEPSHLKGVFEALRDPSFFAQAYVDDGVVTWPGELDIAPDAMHDEIKANGQWILR